MIINCVSSRLPAGASRPYGRLAATVSGLAAAATFIGLAAGVPSDAATGPSAPNAVTVARYHAGDNAAQAANGVSWPADSALQPGGRVVTYGTARGVGNSPLYRSARIDFNAYRIPATEAGQYTVALRYLRCTDKQCTVDTAVDQQSMSAAGTMTVAIPDLAKPFGVATVTVRRSPLPHTPSSTQGSSTPPSPPPSSTGSASSVTSSMLQPENMFGPDSFWRQSISSAPLASNSSAMVANLVGQLTGNAAFNVNQYNDNFYNAAPDTSTTTVGFTNCQNKPKTPNGLYGPGGQFVDVPIPANAVPANGTDGVISVYRASTDQLWNFWKISQTSSGGWQACWGGRIDNVSTSPGYFLHGFGAAASGLATEGGHITINDVQSGFIDHAIGLAIPTPALWKTFSWPAQRSDGTNTDPNAIPEGTRLRLDPSINVDSLNLGPIATMIAKAAQTYGFIVGNRSGCVTIAAESGAPIQNATGTNPWTQLLGGLKPIQVLKNFPWQSLQVLPQNYSK